ncbi:MAG: hypothetical protein WCA57_01070 [Ilumatobacteraceae bacterium]
MQTGPDFFPSRREPVRRFAMDRRRFLIAGAGATAAVVAGCAGSDSSSDASESAPASGPGGTDAPANTTAAGTTPADTAIPAEPLSPAAAALLPPGSPGLMDEATYQARVDDYLAFATSVDHSSNPSGINAHLGRAHRDPDYVWDVNGVTVESLGAVFEQIDNWEDTRDFRFMDLHWMLVLGQGDTPMTQLSPDVIEAIDARMIANRYRYDDPLPADRVDNLWFWSENHRIINLAIEYLAGQRYPDETFTVTGLTGAEHLERAKPDILEWIIERADLGFFEWHSNVYMLKNITPLLMLAELADDPEIVTAAAMALDLCLVDMAAHNHSGGYTAPRGRTYKKDKMTSLDEDTFGTAKFVFDDTGAQYQSTSDTGVTYFASAERYRPPQVVVEIALDETPSVVRERHGVYFDGSSPLEDDPAAPYGKDFSDPANLPFWWSLGALGMWPLAEVSVAAANEFRLWDTSEFGDINLLASINDYDPARIRVWEQERAAVINFGFLSEANTYAYRQPKVSMASVIDHRFGEMRDQGHAWQAAIDENAMVFTNHPVPDTAQSTIWADDSEPGYWTGEAAMPRSAQYQGTAVHIYQPKWDESTDPLVWGVFGYRPFTHAYVPQDHFDEVRQVGNWTIAAKNGAYIALWSWRTPTWREYDPAVVSTNGMVKPFDLVAEGGPDNVWLVEVGSDDGGSLDDFITALTAADPSVVRDDAGFTVSWTSPSAGIVDFSSTGPFLIEGEEQPLALFPRHESPWGGIEHLSRQYNLTAGDATWSCDFDTMTRELS